MFSTDQTQLRSFYKNSWDKFKNKEPLSDLEKQVASIILEHPEYHHFFDNLDIRSDINTNKNPNSPFLHLGLHLGIRDQIAINTPAGISDIYKNLYNQYKDPHICEHKMLEILAEELWESQQNQTEFNTQNYINKLLNLTKHNTPTKPTAQKSEQNI